MSPHGTRVDTGRSRRPPDPKLPASEQSARDRRCYREGHHLTVEALFFNLTKTQRTEGWTWRLKEACACERGSPAPRGKPSGCCPSVRPSSCAQRPHQPGPRHDGQATLGCRCTQERFTKEGLHCCRSFWNLN